MFLRVKCESRELMPDHMLVSWPGDSEPFNQDMQTERYHWVGPQSIETHSVGQDSYGEKQRYFHATHDRGTSTIQSIAFANQVLHSKIQPHD